MTIDFNTEMKEVVDQLRHVEGYLDCEKIIIQNIKNQFARGNTDENVIVYLKNQTAWFIKAIDSNQQHAYCTNLRFAGGFVDLLLRMPHWKSWMITIDA